MELSFEITAIQFKYSLDEIELWLLVGFNTKKNLYYFEKQISCLEKYLPMCVIKLSLFLSFSVEFSQENGHKCIGLWHLVKCNVKKQDRYSLVLKHELAPCQCGHILAQDLPMWSIIQDVILAWYGHKKNRVHDSSNNHYPAEKTIYLFSTHHFRWPLFSKQISQTILLPRDLCCPQGDAPHPLKTYQNQK